jgi:hypothetical protein
MTVAKLAQTAVINLNGSGAGTAKLGPLTAREVWYPDNAHVAVATNTLEATCKVYVGPDTTQSNFRDESPQGSTGDSTGAISADVIRTGFYVWAVWTGGDANAQATLTVTGRKTV